MSTVLDLIVVGIVLAVAFLSARKGFVRIVFELVGFAVATMLAFSLSTPLANAAYDKFIEPSVILSAEKAATGTADDIVNATWEALPKFITKNADSLNLSAESFSAKINETVQSGAANAAQAASQSIVKPVAVKFFGLLFTIILLIIFLFIVKILAKLLNKLFSVSLIGKLNRTLGGVIGALKGVVIAMVFCMAVSLIVSLTSNGFLIFTREAIDGTSIFKLLASFSPLN